MKEITLQEMLSTIIGELRENGRWGTAHIYQSTLNVFSAFNNYRDLHLRKLNPVVLKRFEMHLRQRDCSWNTVSTYMKVIRSAYNRAVDLRCVRYTPRLFEHVYTGTKADKKRALEASDIGTLVRGTEMDLSKRIPSSSLQKAKMLFVFMFMMRGLPFVDLAFLHKKDLQGNVLSYRRRKTGRTLRVLLSPEALQLVHMVSNKDENSPYLFPILRSKDGTEAAYKEYQSALRRFNYQLSALKTHLNMSSHLSSYSARHTWATMAYYCEIHPGIISEAMGHSSITVTETYLKPFQNKKIDEMFFLGGVAKDKVLKAFNAHIFFDDQDYHVGPASQLIPSGRVPYKSDSKLHQFQQHQVEQQPEYHENHEHYEHHEHHGEQS